MSEPPQPSIPGPPATILRFERLVSALLRGGVGLSLVLIVTGTVLTFVHHRDYLASRTQLNTILAGEAYSFPHTVEDALRGLSERQGRSFVIAGLLVLIATPVLRVALSIFAFMHQRDAAFTAITSVVLWLLLLSFLLGRIEG